MKKSSKHLSLVLLVMLIPLVGYALMHGLIYLFPMEGSSDNTASYLFYTLIIIGLGLGVPCLMLKTGFHAAHTRNHKEKELSLADVPKDKEQLLNQRDNH